MPVRPLHPLVAVPFALVVLAASCADGDGGDGLVDAAPSPPASTTSTTEPRASGFVDTNAAVRAEIEGVAGTEEDGPFYMVNLLDFHDVADYPADSEWAGSTGLEANARYNEVSQPAITEIGGQVVFAGLVQDALIAGPADWDLVGIVRYPSRQALVDLGENDEFAAATEHKDASLAHTFALVTDRIDLPIAPTAEDPAFIMVHVIDFKDEASYAPGEQPDDAPISGREAVERYSANAAATALPLGIGARAWFEVEGALIGEHQDWEQVRLNEFPSRAAFQALTSDPGWASGRFHREAGIEQTYALITDPIVLDRTFGG
jgi:uncharacterized protein (DUF1330 family)